MLLLDWKISGFDDSQWQAATEYGSNGASPWGLNEDVAAGARWIWTNDNQGVGTIYCRRRLGMFTLCVTYCVTTLFTNYESMCIVFAFAVNANTTFCITGIELTATCDDVIHVYADGVNVTTTSGSTTYNDVNSVEHHVLSSTSQVIGIKCENTAGVGGILASIDSDGITDTRHWKCSHAAGSGWSEFGIAYNIYEYVHRSRAYKRTYVYSIYTYNNIHIATLTCRKLHTSQ